MEEKITSFFRFEDLRVYAKAVEYGRWVIATIGEPRNEGEKCLISSLTGSALDIALNIAEGSSRDKSQFQHYLKIAKTAIRECVAYTAVANQLGLFDEEACQTSRDLLMEMTRMVGALIISLQRGTNRSHRNEEMPREEEVRADDDFNTTLGSSFFSDLPD